MAILNSLFENPQGPEGVEETSPAQSSYEATDDAEQASDKGEPGYTPEEMIENQYGPVTPELPSGGEL